MLDSVLTLILTNLCTGGLSWLATLKFTRKEAEAGAMAKMQEVYNKLIDDLNEDRESLKEQLEEIRRERAADHEAFNRRIDRLERQVTVNNRLIGAIGPIACVRARSCPNFLLMDPSKLETDEK